MLGLSYMFFHHPLFFGQFILVNNDVACYSLFNCIIMNILKLYIYCIIIIIIGANLYHGVHWYVLCYECLKWWISCLEKFIAIGYGFFHTISCNSWHMCEVNFMYYNIQYVVFIVVTIIVKLQFDIKLWHILNKHNVCHNL